MGGIKSLTGAQARDGLAGAVGGEERRVCCHECGERHEVQGFKAQKNADLLLRKPAFILLIVKAHA